MKKLMIIGASGVMGKRVLAISRRLLPEVYLIGASRHITSEKSENHFDEARRIDIFDTPALKENFRDVDVVINTVGAFEYDPTRLLEACFEAECHYIDIAETEQYIRQVREITEKFSEERRKSSNSKSVYNSSGCSTVPGLIAVLAQEFNKHADLKSMDVFLSLGSRKKVSPTLLYSLLRPLGRKSDDGTKYYKTLKKKLIASKKPGYFGRYPAPFETEGIKIGRRAVPANFFVGMDRVVYGYALQTSSLFLPFLSDRMVWNLYYFVHPIRPLIKRFGGDLGLLILTAKDKNGKILDEIEVRADREGLNIPALPAVWTARALLEAEDEIPTGFVELKDLFTPLQVSEWLCGEGFEVKGISRKDYESNRDIKIENKSQAVNVCGKL